MHLFILILVSVLDSSAPATLSTSQGGAPSPKVLTATWLLGPELCLPPKPGEWMTPDRAWSCDMEGK